MEMVEESFNLLSSCNSTKRTREIIHCAAGLDTLGLPHPRILQAMPQKEFLNACMHTYINTFIKTARQT